MNPESEPEGDERASEYHVQLSAWDYANLYFLRDAHSLSPALNQELMSQVKIVGLKETAAIYINSSVSAFIIYLVMWLNSDSFEHAPWVIVLVSLTVIPVTVLVFLMAKQKAGTLTYRQFAWSQLGVLPFGVTGWGTLGFHLAPANGISAPTCLGFVIAACVYTIIWFKTIPLATLIWSTAFSVIISRLMLGWSVFTFDINNVFFSGTPDYPSAVYTVIFIVGINGIAIYLFIAELNSQLNKIALAKTQSLNQMLINTFEKNSKDFLWQTDTNGVITYASTQLQKIIDASKRTQSSIVSNPMLDSENEFGIQLKTNIGSGKPFDMVLVEMMYENMVEHWAVTGEPLFDIQNTVIGYSGFGSNVTAVQQAEHRKNLVERYQSMTRMALMIGHDFNNYLATIDACMQLIKITIDEKDQVEKHLALAAEAMKDAVNMTTQLLHLGAQTPKGTTQLNLREILEKVANETLAVHGSNLRIEQNIPEGASLCADATQLARTARNVLENSASAINYNGKIEIEVEALEADSEGLRALKTIRPVKVEQDYWAIRFADNGPGFPEELLSKVFEPFMTTKSNEGGTGLGLAMVANFCLQLKGFAVARNGQKTGARNGAVVELILPMDRPRDKT